MAEWRSAFVAATNRRLDDLIAGGLFREDLFYRLAVISLHVPPLRERQRDIPRLAEHFLRGFCAPSGLHEKRFAPSALEALSGHPWPGNVRELRNCVERLVMMVPGERIEASDLDLPQRAALTPAGDSVPPVAQPPASRLQAALETLPSDPSR
jgi:DNA-binding NtrC family response regulator